MEATGQAVVEQAGQAIWQWLEKAAPGSGLAVCCFDDVKVARGRFCYKPCFGSPRHVQYGFF
jgi:hypothetical protein